MTTTLTALDVHDLAAADLGDLGRALLELLAEISDIEAAATTAHRIHTAAGQLVLALTDLERLDHPGTGRTVAQLALTQLPTALRPYLNTDRDAVPTELAARWAADARAAAADLNALASELTSSSSDLRSPHTRGGPH